MSHRAVKCAPFVMNDSNIFLKALDRAVSVLTSAPENAGRPTRVAVQPQSESIGNIAAAINANIPGQAGAPMDRVERRPPLPPGLLDGFPYLSQNQMRLCDKRLLAMGFKRNETALAQLQAEDVVFMRLQEGIAKAFRSQNSRYLAHLENIAERTAQGDTTVEKEDAWSREEWAEDGRLRGEAFKGALKTQAGRCWIIAEPELLRKAEYAHRAAEELDAEARVRFAEFGAPYTPPTYVLMFWRYAATLSDSSRRACGKPTTMIEAL